MGGYYLSELLNHRRADHVGLARAAAQALLRGGPAGGHREAPAIRAGASVMDSDFCDQDHDADDASDERGKAANSQSLG